MAREETETITLQRRYVLQKKLGQGGFGSVYLGVDQQLKRQVAVKILSLAEVPPEDVDNRVARFDREARLLASVAHPNIVAVYDFGKDEELGASYLVMEFVAGKSVRALLDWQAEHHPESLGALDLQATLEMAVDVLDALHHAHQLGIIHRDLKPDNVMLADKTKLMDFGLGKIVSGEANKSFMSLTQDASMFGTPAYMPPEQVAGTAADQRSDLYSFGVMLFEMTTGSQPFEGDTPLAVAFQHLGEMPPSPQSLNPAISPRLEAIILKLLEKKPDDRYQSALEARDAVRVELNALLAERHQDAVGAGLAKLTADVQVASVADARRPPWKTVLRDGFQRVLHGRASSSFVAALLATLLAGSAAAGGLFAGIQEGIQNRVNGPGDALPPPVAQAAQQVVIVGYDEASVQAPQLGWPPTRDAVATVVEHLADAGARTIYLGFLYDVPRPEDARLATALSRAGNVILQLNGERAVPQDRGRPSYRSLIAPVPELKSAATRVAHGDTLLDHTGTASRVPLEIVSGGNVVPAAAVAIVNNYRRETGLSLTPLGRGQVRVGSQTVVPIDGRGAMYIDYSHWPAASQLPPHFSTVSFADVFTGKVQAEVLKNKIVLVGATTVSSPDILVTPAGRMHGIEAIAEEVTTLLSGRFVQLAPLSMTVLVILLVSLIASLLVTFLGPLWGTAVVIVELVLYAIVALQVSAATGVLLSVFHPMLAIVLSTIATVVYRTFWLSRQNRTLSRRVTRMRLGVASGEDPVSGQMSGVSVSSVSRSSRVQTNSGQILAIPTVLLTAMQTIAATAGGASDERPPEQASWSGTAMTHRLAVTTTPGRQEAAQTASRLLLRRASVPLLPGVATLLPGISPDGTSGGASGPLARMGSVDGRLACLAGGETPEQAIQRVQHTILDVPATRLLHATLKVRWGKNEDLAAYTPTSLPMQSWPRATITVDVDLSDMDTHQALNLLEGLTASDSLVVTWAGRERELMVAGATRGGAIDLGTAVSHDGPR